MATRNVIDYQGNTIGTLTLPDSTTEAEWQARLAPYAYPPPSPTYPNDLKLAKVITSSTTDSTSLTTYEVMDGLSDTPRAGRYIVVVSANFELDTETAGEVIIGINSIPVSETVRGANVANNAVQSAPDGQSTAVGFAEVVLDGTQTIQGMFKATEGTFVVKQRSMMLALAGPPG